MPRKFLAVVALPVLLSGCATTAGSIRLNADRAFLTSQIALKSAQQTVASVCSVPNKPVATCNEAIDVLHRGALAETAGFTAQQTGNAADLQAAVTTLTALPSQLVALGILEAN